MPARSLAAVLFTIALLVGCVGAPGSTDAPPSASSPTTSGGLSFTVKLIDDVRAGGEPVIQVTQKGTLLVGAHPGWTHTRYPPSADLVTPASGQSYMWRSTDNGTTWKPLGLPMTDGVGPRGLGQGVSDPDFAMDSKGRVYFTDLEGLGSASVSWSDDDGATWLQGNDVAASFGGAPIDRNWIATHGTDVYFMGNYFTGGENVLKSSDGGITWTKVGTSPCEQEFITNDDGALLIGCPTGIAVSTDGGAHFEKRDVPGASSKLRAMSAPALDSAGNVYVTWANESGIWLAGSPDLGKTWWQTIHVSQPLFASGQGTHIWPWVVAGDAGRVAIDWYGTNSSGGPDKATGDWFVYQTTVLGADGSAPALYAAQVTPTPIFKGGICQGGTGCQADPTPAGDRRLGDFFEATADANGMVLVAFSVVGSDSISHPGFARQTAGPGLVKES
ncbi:MAG: sialidase family protein [Candidatus Thermoplasmatota archaeon]